MEFDDIVKIVDQVKGLEDRLAVVEAEREKYQGLADNRLNCMALYRDLIGKHEARIGVLADKLNLAGAERDAAKAGEARAAEALEAEQRAAHWRNLARITDKHEDHIEATRLSEIAQRLRHGIVLVLDRNISALAWLAQQRREAAAEVVNALADGCERAKRPILAQELRGHVAALLAGATGGAEDAN